MHTLVASDAMVRLTQTRHTAVITYQKSTTGLTIILVLTAFGQISLIHTFIIMYQDRRNIDTVRTRHAILAIVARHRGIFKHQLCRLFQKFLILIGQWN